MKQRQVGIVTQLFRYPVKSMLGENLAELEIGQTGVIGDRAWGLREQNGRIATAKKWANLLEFRATYEAPPSPHASAPVSITLPDGRQIRVADADASATLSTLLGRPVTLQRARPDERARGEIDPKTVFGEVAVERVMPQFTAATLPDTFGLYPGSFCDSAGIHLVATGSLAHLRSLIGDDAQTDPRRFRPNIVVDTGQGAGESASRGQSQGAGESASRGQSQDQDRFVEDEWLDGELRIGEHVRIVSLRAALRCVMTTHRQSDLARDPRILRATAQHHQARLGVFAAIGAPGMVRTGDRVWLVT